MTIYSKNPPFLFIRIPRTGSTTMKETLQPHGKEYRIPIDELQNVIVSEIDKKNQKKSTPHGKLYDLQKIYPKLNYKKAFKCMFVRNPWDRVVSSYLHQTQVKKVGEMSLEEFINIHRGSNNLLPQVEFGKNSDGKLEMDYIGRFENLKHDYHQICKKIGIKPIALIHKNKSTNRKPYQAYYNEKTKAMVAEIFAEDIETFGYTF